MNYDTHPNDQTHQKCLSLYLPPCIISGVCVRAQIFCSLTVVDDVLHLLPDSEGQVAQVSWHMNQSSRRRLWIRLWWDLDSGRTFSIRTEVTLDQKQRDPRHQQITHLSIETGNFCRTNTPFIINNPINQSINKYINQTHVSGPVQTTCSNTLSSTVCT